MYECQTGCSGCCGPKTTIALTDSRVICRHKQPNSCFCCAEGAHIDTAIFLQDIELLRESADRRVRSCPTILLALLNCTWPCLLCSICCGSCCGDHPKTLQAKGGFGAEELIFNKNIFKTAANDISSMILPIKNRR